MNLAAAVSGPAVAGIDLAVARFSSAVAGRSQAAAGRGPAVTEQDPAVAGFSPAAARRPPAVAVTGRAVARLAQAVAVMDPAVAASNPAVAEQDPAAARLSPAAAGLSPTVARSSPVVAGLDPAGDRLVPAAAGRDPAMAAPHPAASELYRAVAGLGTATAKLNPAMAVLAQEPARSLPDRGGVSAAPAEPAWHLAGCSTAKPGYHLPMTIRTENELTALRAVGRIAAEVLEAMRRAVCPGITTAEIDRVAREVMERHGARSAPELVYKFPAATCISVNDEVVHGVPGSRVLEPGDVVKLDVTVEKDGFMSDTACTAIVEPRSALGRRLASCAKQALEAALAVAKAGQPISKVGRVVEDAVRRQGFSVIRQLCGHGIGRTIHEDPEVPNFFDPNHRGLFEEGMVLTIEPIIAAGSGTTRHAGDGWTIKTSDASLAAHFEHTLAITRGRPVLLTAA